jgi:hypothetical protein
MKKIDLIFIDFLREQRENIIVLIVMTFMIFLITQSIGYARYLNNRNEVFSVVDLEKSYWVTLTPDKSKEMNDSFKNVQTEKDYLSIVKNEIMELPSIKSVSFIGKQVAINRESNSSLIILAYDNVMMKMIDVLITNGETINLKNLNEVLISEELSTTFKIGDEVYFNLNNREIGRYVDDNSIKLIIKGIVESDYLPNMQQYGDNVIVCSSKLFEEYKIDGFLHEAFIQTDTNEQLAETFNKKSPEIGFFMSFTDFYSSDKNGEFNFLKKQLIKQTCILIICIICVASLNFVGLYKKRYEFGIYFLSGASVSSIVFLSTVKNLILILISIFLGFGLTIYTSEINNILNRVYDYKTFILSFCIAIAIYVISSIPIYLELKNQDLIKIIKDVK